MRFAVLKRRFLQNAHGLGYVIVASTPKEDTTWPDDLQVTLAMDNVTKAEIRKATGAEIGRGEEWPSHALSATRQTFDAGDPISMTLEIENISAETRDLEIRASKCYVACNDSSTQSP